MQNIVHSSEEELIFSFVLQLNHYFVLSLFLHFLTSLVKGALWILGNTCSFGSWETRLSVSRGRGHEICHWERPHRVLLVSALLPSRMKAPSSLCPFSLYPQGLRYSLLVTERECMHTGRSCVRQLGLASHHLIEHWDGCTQELCFKQKLVRLGLESPH